MPLRGAKNYPSGGYARKGWKALRRSPVKRHELGFPVATHIGKKPDCGGHLMRMEHVPLMHLDEQIGGPPSNDKLFLTYRDGELIERDDVVGGDPRGGAEHHLIVVDTGPDGDVGNPPTPRQGHQLRVPEMRGPP